eukprot:5178965-Pleurochrysis_carterae.AAC.1
MQLALPFSLLHSSIVSYGQPSDFGSLGIGVELYFSQVIYQAAFRVHRLDLCKWEGVALA